MSEVDPKREAEILKQMPLWVQLVWPRVGETIPFLVGVTVVAILFTVL